MREKVLEVCMEIDDTIDYTATNLIDGDLLDSLTLVEIVTALMEEFDVEIPYEDIIPDNFNSIDAMKELVERYV